MSLVRLLAAGKSLVGLQDMESRYRMRRRNLLPKFGSSKNPFLARTEAPSLPLPASRATTAAPNAAEMTSAKVAATALKKTTPLPVVSPRIVEPKRSSNAGQRWGCWHGSAHGPES
jgi:hypothetical protein